MPCRNEEAFLSEIVREVPDDYDEIIVVSNASTDRTEEIGREIEKQNKKFKLLIDNRKDSDGIGYGFAHITGITSATGDIIVCADADGTYPIGDIFEIVEYMNKKRIDFVSCNRYPITNEDVKISGKLRFGVAVLNIETRILYGFRVKDILSGMWVFRREIVNDLKLTEGGWNLSPQIKINAFQSPSIALSSFHIDQKIRYGETKQDYFKTGFNHFKWIWKNRINRNI